MVPQRPFVIGSPGWVRSSAWIWLFSSTQSTIACSGGFRYRPTTSVIFSRNFGSRESLKVSVRWGWILWARQILLTVDLLTPWLCAMVRQLQCVIPAGLVCRVASPAGSDVPQTVQSLVTKALAPQNHRVSVHRQPPSNGDLGLTGR